MISNCCQQINTNAFIDHDEDDDHDDDDDPRSSASAAMQMWTKQTNNSTSTNLGHPAQPNYFVACDGNPCKVFKDLIIFQNLLYTISANLEETRLKKLSVLRCWHDL